MTQRNFNNLPDWGANASNKPEPVLEAKERGGPSALDDYLPVVGDRCKIRQIYDEDGDFVFQELKGSGWRGKMRRIARSLKMKNPTQLSPGRFHIIDNNVKHPTITIGPKGDRWTITQWEVIADSSSPDPDNHRFIDKITWKSADGLATFESIHKWRIY